VRLYMYMFVLVPVLDEFSFCLWLDLLDLHLFCLRLILLLREFFFVVVGTRRSTETFQRIRKPTE